MEARSLWHLHLAGAFLRSRLALINPNETLNPKTRNLHCNSHGPRPRSVTPELTCHAQFFGDLGAKKLANLALPPTPEILDLKPSALDSTTFDPLENLSALNPERTSKLHFSPEGSQSFSGQLEGSKVCLQSHDLKQRRSQKVRAASEHTVSLKL